MNAHEILGVSTSATQKEIYSAYRKLALKYHPDKNRGNEEWAKKKFIEVSEAYKNLSNPSTFKARKNYDFSGKSSAEKFKMAFEMMAEMEKNLGRMEEDLSNAEENLNREEERLKDQAIQNMEEIFSLNGVSASDLNSSLWSPYSDWREKVRNSVDSGLEIFLSEMRIGVSQAKARKSANYYNSSYRSSPNHDNNPPPNFSNRNFSPSDGGWTGNKPFSTKGDKIQQLEAEIEYNRNHMFQTPYEEEKKKCQKVISRLEKELERLRNKNNNANPNNRTDSTHYYPSNNSSGSNDNISKKEQELSNLKNRGNDNNAYDDDWYEEYDQEKLNNEFKKLKAENKTDELAKKVSQLEKVIQQLVKEIQELKSEIKELKEQKQKNNLSEYQTYYLSRQENQIMNRQSKLEQLQSVISNDSISNDFPIGLVIGGGILLVLLVAKILVFRRVKKIFQCKIWSVNALSKY